jgi:ubiquinone/menaquinone biosynthesis C-methylase UbiE
MTLRPIDYNGLASEYARHRGINPVVLRELVSSGNIHKSSRVLEVGCGTGNYILELNSITGCQSWGIDPSGQMLSKANERYGQVHFQLGRAERLEFQDNFFDLVFSVDVIHHLASRSDFFRETFRVLRTGSRVCTVTDSEWIIKHREPLSVYFPETVEVELKRYPPISELKDTMTRTGFREIDDKIVEFRYMLKDTKAYREKAYSILQLVPEEDFQRGLNRLEEDLVKGPIICVSRYLLLWGTKTEKLSSEPGWL